VHVDHGLRTGSAEDGDFARRTCRELRVPFAIVRVKVAPGNVQAQARRIRYQTLREEAAGVGATRIATGHTRSDQAETLLLRLLRGSGSRGLSGIPPRRGAIVRPLIDRSRAEVLAYLQAVGLGWREDPSNATPRYARNRVRHELLPVAVRLAPAAERALARAADLLRADERALSARARACAEGAEVERARLLEEPLAVRRRVIRLLWRRSEREPGELTAGHVETVLSHLRRTGPWRLSLPGRVEARCRYGRIEVGPAGSTAAGEVLEPVVLGGPGSYVLAGRAAVLRVAAARPELVPWPLEVRTRRPGDRFRPEHGTGSKKLKAWLIDRKIPRERRDAILVVAAGPTVLAMPELGVRAREAGRDGAGLEVRIAAADPGSRPHCKGGPGLL
jgi:tRNA(Ile)-lysidine synthase